MIKSFNHALFGDMTMLYGSFLMMSAMRTTLEAISDDFQRNVMIIGAFAES